ncbi:hypothetical protein [Desulfopila sp. IMCC35008]|uniref:hypothetical protein n=1 Tax=Desulfopila sp. IMCC35008 TaxID=2653858 RepID=UPI0013D02A6F|nr:hypothetical protein [Desulfopila sp. IMCC35008]
MTLRQLIIMVSVLTAVSAASAADYAVGIDEWLHIPVAIPQQKAGGGDFYNLQLEPLHSGKPVEYELVQEGINVRSGTAGVYDFRVVVNHVTKSSCAGVEVNEFSNQELRLYVRD